MIRSPRIRPYRSSDEAAVIEVYLSATIPGQSFLPERFWRESVPEIRDVLMPIAETWVLEDGDRVVAFASLLDDGQGGRLIGGLFTRPDYQSRGYGAALVNHVGALHDRLSVEVFAANERAHAFYLRCGFVDHERRANVATGLAEIVMAMKRPQDDQSRKQSA